MGKSWDQGRVARISGLLLLLVFKAPVAFSDDFFGDRLSVREQYSFDASIESMKSTGESLGALQLLMMYQSFSEGRCEDYFAVESAAKKGDEKNQYILSDLYRQGYCVPQDDARALYWVRQAAEGGYEDAYYDLGIFLVHGIGTEKRPGAAVPWLEKATALRIEAYHQLALIYFSGAGVTQNFGKAHKYALRGAALGDPAAQAITAMIEAQAGFDFSDPVDAYKWVLLANASGQQNILEALSDLTETLEESLDTSQISRAQSAAASFMPLSLEPPASPDPTDVDLPEVDAKEILELSADQANARLDSLKLDRDRYLFFKAIAEDNLAVTALFIRAGASPETRSPTMYDTALLHAARNGSGHVTRFLVSEGADIDKSVNHDNDTPVLVALSGGHRELAEYLIAQGAELDHPGIMYNAVEFDDRNFLAMLVSKGVPIDQEYVGTPLSHAVSAMDDDGDRRCYPESAAYLIEQGARLDGKDFLGQSLLQIAIDAVNPTECVRLLLKSGVSQASEYGREPLFIAILSGHTDVVRLLLEHGADPNLTYSLPASKVPMILEGEAKSAVMSGGSVLQLAVVEQHAAVARLLVRHGADPNAADELGRTPLSIATDRGDSLMVSVLRGEM